MIAKITSKQSYALKIHILLMHLSALTSETMRPADYSAAKKKSNNSSPELELIQF